MSNTGGLLATSHSSIHPELMRDRRIFIVISRDRRSVNGVPRDGELQAFTNPETANKCAATHIRSYEISIKFYFDGRLVTSVYYDGLWKVDVEECGLFDRTEEAFVEVEDAEGRGADDQEVIGEGQIGAD